MEKEYRKLENVIPNKKIVGLLSNLRAGRDSELTGMNTYLFQQYITDYIAIKDILKDIAEDEMEHFNLLSNAIVLYGGTPYVANGNGNLWNGGYVNYEQNTEQFLRDDIRDEEKGIKDYTYAISQIDNESVKEMIRGIIEDEQEHKEFLEQALADYMV